MISMTLQKGLNGLLARFSWLTLGSDITSMGLLQLWGAYCLLRLMAEP